MSRYLQISILFSKQTYTVFECVCMHVCIFMCVSLFISLSIYLQDKALTGPNWVKSSAKNSSTLNGLPSTSTTGACSNLSLTGSAKYFANSMESNVADINTTWVWRELVRSNFLTTRREKSVSWSRSCTYIFNRETIIWTK